MNFAVGFESKVWLPHRDLRKHESNTSYKLLSRILGTKMMMSDGEMIMKKEIKPS